jgi:sugar phosphate isomerase/epimerase
MIIEGREDCRMGLEILGDYLAYVHVKNCVWRPSGGRWCHQWAALREGMVDWPDTVAALKACGYEGYLSVENLYQVPLFRGLVGEVTGSDGAVRPVTDRLREDIAYLRAIERTIREAARPRATRG